VTEDVALDFDREGRVVGLDIINASRALGESIQDIRMDALVSVKEAAELVGVQKSNFVRDYANKPDFPVPSSWLATAASGFGRRRRRTRPGKPGQALAARRRGVRRRRWLAAWKRQSSGSQQRWLRFCTWPSPGRCGALPKSAGTRARWTSGLLLVKPALALEPVGARF
jgi:hypothetical protein